MQLILDNCSFSELFGFDMLVMLFLIYWIFDRVVSKEESFRLMNVGTKPFGKVRIIDFTLFFGVFIYDNLLQIFEVYLSTFRLKEFKDILNSDEPIVITVQLQECLSHTDKAV